MAGTFKEYKLETIKDILTNFTIMNPKQLYIGGEEVLEVKCNKCKSEFTKKIKNLTNKCRTCSVKKIGKEHQLNKNKIFLEKYPNTKIIEGNRQYNYVEFICNSCGKTKQKTIPNYEKNQLCTNCSTTISSTHRECKKGSKLDRIINILDDNNEVYSIDEFKDVYSNITITCKCGKTVEDKIYRVLNFSRNHNKFECRECTKRNKLKTSAYNMVRFYENSDLGKNTGYFYMYTIEVDGIKSYKIGITRNSILDRIRKVSKLYNISDIMYMEDTNLNVAKLERKLKKKYRNYKILPENKFEGYTECFTVPILLEEKMKVQRLSHDGSTLQANGSGSGQLHE